MTETYNIDDLRIDGQQVPAGSMTVGVDWGYGSDETSVALLERKPAGNYEVKWSAPLNRRESMRLTGRSEHICWKCRDGRTRAHHRLCSKRGGSSGNSAPQNGQKSTNTVTPVHPGQS